MRRYVSNRSGSDDRCTVHALREEPWSKVGSTRLLRRETGSADNGMITDADDLADYSSLVRVQ